jgi:hypothetical protein
MMQLSVVSIPQMTIAPECHRLNENAAAKATSLPIVASFSGADRNGRTVTAQSALKIGAK